MQIIARGKNRKIYGIEHAFPQKIFGVPGYKGIRPDRYGTG